jgi:hypothetical protein
MGVAHTTPANPPDTTSSMLFTSIGDYLVDHDGVSYQIIAESILSAPAATITFSNVPQTYRGLRLDMVLRGDDTPTSANLLMRFNSDSGGNYDLQYTQAQGSTLTTGDDRALTYGYCGKVAAAGAAAGLASSSIIFIPDYARTTYEKSALIGTALKFGTAALNLVLYDLFVAWRSTAAINAVSIFAATGNLDTGAVATLRGVV